MLGCAALVASSSFIEPRGKTIPVTPDFAASSTTSVEGI